MKKIKVVHHTKGCGYSGTDRTAQLFCQYLDRSKFEPYIVYRENADCSRVNFMKRELEGSNVVEYDHEHGNNVSPYWPKRDNFVDVIRSINPDIIHFHRSGHTEWPCLPFLKKEFPKVKFVETNIFAHNDNFPWDLRLFICPYIATRAGHPDGSYLYNPVELPYCGEGSDDSDIVVLGRIGRQDNFYDISLQACRLLLGRGIKNWKYLIVNPCDKWINRIHELGLDKYCEPIVPIYDNRSLSRFYSLLDVFAHSRSDGECQSVCMSEAQIHGVPIVTHKSPCWNGQVDQINLSNCGFCVGWNDAVGYADNLQALIESKSLRERLGGNGRRWANHNVEASVVVKQLEGYYEGLI